MNVSGIDGVDSSFLLHTVRTTLADSVPFDLGRKLASPSTGITTHSDTGD